MNESSLPVIVKRQLAAPNRVVAIGVPIHFSTMRGMPTVIPLAIAAIVALGVAVAAWALHAPPAPINEPTSAPAMTVAQSAATPEWQVSPLMTAVDSNGLSARVQLLTLSSAFEWQFASNEVAFNGRPASLHSHIQSPGISTILLGSAAVAVVAASSEEGENARERQRSDSRARTLYTILSEALPLPNPMWTVSLGKFIGKPNGGGAQATSSQRRIVIVAILQI